MRHNPLMFLPVLKTQTQGLRRTELKDGSPQFIHMYVGLTGLAKVKADNLSIESWLDSFMSHMPRGFSIMAKYLF